MGLNVGIQPQPCSLSAAAAAHCAAGDRGRGPCHEEEGEKGEKGEGGKGLPHLLLSATSVPALLPARAFWCETNTWPAAVRCLLDVDRQHTPEEPQSQSQRLTDGLHWSKQTTTGQLGPLRLVELAPLCGHVARFIRALVCDPGKPFIITGQRRTRRITTHRTSQSRSVQRRGAPRESPQGCVTSRG